ncbi:DUF6311 domain-containing protein [Pseudomonas sp. MAG002Y]|uniref:DUF6311 domain-containing protein n=1 Tax=Pseudomonas sp. MAG002Y TaxID=2678690 RepID=UPI001C6089F0|nr:DUF6311 domain-containing protein [Pseudomonas sp. MAG002Y]MBW5413094.1 hypothetical protein [Pseudomonas sp. MAG002Y]
MQIRTGWLAILDQPLTRDRYYGLAFLIALIYTCHVFPLSFFTGSSGFWFDTRTDPTQHITGMWAFAQDAWHFPLLYTDLLNAPQGVSAAFTDSIPLAAIPFKFIYKWLAPDSHFFGVWMLGCYVMQGIAGAYAAASFKAHTLSAAIAGTLFAVMMPSLMIRIPHAALNAQFLLIFMLAFYVRLRRGELSGRGFLLAGGSLLLLAATIHPYLLAMLFPLYAVALLAAQLSGSMISWRGTFAGLLVPLPLLFAVLYCLGYLSLAKGLPPPEGGFIESSMNLLSPLLGTQLAPSVFLPSKGITLDATGMQIDGHNYLGVSLLLMLIYLIMFHTKQLLISLRKHWLMALLMLGLTLYSLSNRIYLGSTVVAEYPLPGFMEPLTHVFRGSGRFFWPVGYALLISALGLFLCRAHPGYRLILLLLVVLQYIDTRHHRGYLAEAAGRQPYFAYDRNEWDARVANARQVYLLPTYGCGGSGTDALFLQYFSALHAVPLNTGFIARVVTACEDKASVLDRPRQSKELFIFGHGTQNKVPQERIEHAMQGHYAEWCQEEAIGTVCTVP